MRIRRTSGGITSTANPPSAVTFDLNYDLVGNIKERYLDSNTKYVYAHDTWNRLIKVNFIDDSTTKQRTSIGTAACTDLHGVNPATVQLSTVHNSRCGTQPPSKLLIARRCL